MDNQLAKHCILNEKEIHEIGQGFIQMASQCGFEEWGGGHMQMSYLHMAMHVAITFIRD